MPFQFYSLIHSEFGEEDSKWLLVAHLAPNINETSMSFYKKRRNGLPGVPRLTGKTRITGKTTEIPERPKNNRGLFPVLILLALFV